MAAFIAYNGLHFALTLCLLVAPMAGRDSLPAGLL